MRALFLAIIATEISFWLLVLAGVTARYFLGLRRLGVVLLAATPLVDIALLLLIIVDLRNGATPHWSHGIGAIYLGFTVTYGYRIVRWADRRFAAIKTGQPVPSRPKLYGSERIRHEWRETLVFWGAVAIAIGVLILCIALAGGPSAAPDLVAWIWRLLMIAGLSTLIPIGYMVFPSREPKRIPQ